MQFVAAVSVVAGQDIDFDRRLAYEGSGSVVGIGQSTPSPKDVMDLRTIAVVDGTLSEELSLEVVVFGSGRIVAQLLVFDDDVAHVDPEAGHAPVEPESKNIVEGRTDVFVPPVEIRLLGEMVVQIELAGGGIEGPGRAPEAAHPVVGGRTLGCGVGPDVPVALGRRLRGPGVHEPGMLFAGVIGDQIHEDPYSSAARPGHQGIEKLDRSQIGFDGTVVGDVVSPIGVGRQRDGTQPDTVDSQPLEVVETVDDPLQITISIGVRVGEGPGIDLVENAGLPPWRVDLGHVFGSGFQFLTTTQHTPCGM